MTKKTEFLRIFSPRTEKAVKAISLLTNGVRYDPTPTETEHMLDVLKDAVNDIASLYGRLPAPLKENVKIAEAASLNGPMEETSDERVEAKKEAIDRGGWPHHSIDARVRSIPDNQLTAYMTQLLHRMSEKFDTT